ncbi:poly-beta-1,6-N-acetyl-D-glucosamine biosynthesis protein PgaD [Luteibacter aegosomaticola]|uniref:poly-beta-1,6-N-acetyl-D-glucosamine biosynthesis protein PgaD n=1 Tax=Luteibacter aegosomaticola TaxID=2911538 RepID=UPI001FFB1C59|nr:poly-beta-1,6-N-acetyl-D-glucosamine biosynthesis protein PgaD [Luteibacter aegosomaticola]UPG91984.1 poly-beta-1,6-N-acetyl-D-glucosamine biosynthesis protein PgaD [Luteibacter aegosomaticola]
MKADTIMIDRPEKQSLPRRIAYALLTIVAWLLWGFLWLPALHAAANRLGLPPSWERWIPNEVLGSARELTDIMWLAPLSLLVFAAWSLYDSRQRRKTRQRRSKASPVPIPAAAELLGTTVHEAILVQESRRAVIDVNEDDHISVPEADAAPGNVVDFPEKRQSHG